MANTLEFAMGLDTGNFIKNVVSAEAVMEGLRKMGDLIRDVWSRTWDAIERGAALEHLSRQTGESVKSLYQLQEAFKAVGVDAGQIPNMLLRMQQAMSGIGRGSQAYTMFARLGLDVTQLKSLDAAGQIDVIAQALGRLDRATATGFASQMFGMQTGAMPFLQVVGASKDFHQAMQAVAQDAEVMARNSAAFEKLEATMGFIKSHANTLFAGVAQGLAPTLQKLEDKLNSLDFSEMGKRLGSIVSAFANAIAGGQMSTLIAAAITDGLRAAVEFIPGLLEALGNALLHVFETPLVFLEAGLTWITEKLSEWIYGFLNKLPERVQKVMGLDATKFKGYKADTFEQIYTEQKGRGLELFNTTLDEGMKDAIDRLKKEITAAGGDLAPLLAMVDGLADKVGAAGEAPAKNSPRTGGVITQQHYKPEFTQFEKMGFVMSGAGNPLTDYARRTADGIDRAVAILQQLAGGGVPSIPLGNEV